MGQSSRMSLVLMHVTSDEYLHISKPEKRFRAQSKEMSASVTSSLGDVNPKRTRKPRIKLSQV